MRKVLTLFLTTMMSAAVVSNALSQKPLGYLSPTNQSQDGSLIKPENSAYTEAMELARFLTNRGITVRSVHQSKLESLFSGVEKAAFFKTDNGVLDVVFFPDPAAAERVTVGEQRKSGRYIYAFHGQPHPKPGDGIDSDRPAYFLTHRNWFIITENKELYKSVKDVLNRG